MIEWIEIPVAIRVIYALLVGLLLAGYSATMLIQRYYRLQLSPSEFWSIATVLSLFINPGILAISTLISSELSPILPYIISFTLAALAIVTNSKGKGLSYNRIFFITTLLYITIVSIVIFAYPTLPDSDPYTWLTRTSEFFKNSNVIQPTERPLFYYIHYIIAIPTDINQYMVFKYIMPYAILLTLPSLWMVARLLKNPLHRFIFLLVPMLSPSTLLYSTTPIPQTFMMVIFICVFCWLIYADSTKQKEWYYASGALIAGGYFYHESALLLFLAWGLVTVLSSMRLWYRKVTQQTGMSILLALLILTNIRLLYKPLSLVRYWTTTAWYHIGDTNWLFPLSYVNIDGKDVGWGNLLGVAKYYLYYVGPPVLWILAGILVLIIRHRGYRNFCVYLLRHSRVAQVIAVASIVFFSLSEIIPRIFNVAFLPERAWFFTGTFTVYFLLTYIVYAQKNNVIIHYRYSIVLITLITISIGGALYINQRKKSLIPDYQLAAADWIKNNLSQDRILLTTGNGNLLTFHSLSRTKLVDPELFCEKSPIRDSIISQIAAGKFNVNDDIQETRPYRIELLQYLNTNPEASVGQILEIARSLKANNSTTAQKTQLDLRPPVYVFYAKTDEHNPYSIRPYFKKNPIHSCNQPSPNEYPNFFQQVYNDHDRVIVWHVL